MTAGGLAKLNADFPDERVVLMDLLSSHKLLGLELAGVL